MTRHPRIVYKNNTILRCGSTCFNCALGQVRVQVRDTALPAWSKPADIYFTVAFIAAIDLSGSARRKLRAVAPLSTTTLHGEVWVGGIDVVGRSDHHPYTNVGKTTHILSILHMCITRCFHCRGCTDTSIARSLILFCDNFCLCLATINRSLKWRVAYTWNREWIGKPRYRLAE